VSTLRNVLRLQAVVWVLAGLALMAAPGVIIDRWLDQPPELDAVWLRLLGLACVVLAAQMILVVRKLDDIWWWSWSFVLLEIGTLLIAALHLAAGLDPHAQAWPWWALVAATAAFAAGLVVGLAKAGTERSPT
jgi:hypothetical protein